MRDRLKWGLSAVFLMLSLPYVILILANGRQGIGVGGNLPELEYRVLERLAREDLSWMEDGTVELLAILYRTEEEGAATGKEDTASGLEPGTGLGAEYKRAYEAVKRTAGKVIRIGGEKKEIPYHMISAGRTRDGQALGADYSYILSVDCPKDLEAQNYLSICFLSEEELRAALGKDYQDGEIGLTRDGADYVIAASCGEALWQGEEFRELLHLPSDCFSIEKVDDSFRIVSRGVGHGFGVSLYTANEEIREGRTAKEIFEEFYQDFSCISIP